MAECDSDLEGNQQEITIHDDDNDMNGKVLIPINKESKKRTFSEMNNDNDHYTANHSNHKQQKLIDDFLDDDDFDDDDEENENEDDGIIINKESSLIQNVEFELQDIRDSYYHEIKDMLSASDWDQKN